RFLSLAPYTPLFRSSRLFGVAGDPETGAPTTELVVIDPATGIVVPDGLTLPLAAQHLAFDPAVDEQDGHRYLRLIAQEPGGPATKQTVQLPEGIVFPPSLLPELGLVTGFGYDVSGREVLAVYAGDTTDLFGDEWSDELPHRLDGLAIPPSCPAPCFGTPREYASGSGHVAAGDLDGDGDVDVVGLGGWPSYPVVVLRNDGAGTFTEEAPIPFGHRPLDLAMADFDGDGVLDVVVLSEDRELHLLRGDGAGGLASPSSAGHVGQAAYELLVGDLTVDGVNDLFTGAGAVLNDGTGAFQEVPSHFDGESIWPLALARIDGDELLDMVAFVGGSGEAVVAFVSDGSGGVTEVSRRAIDG